MPDYKCCLLDTSDIVEMVDTIHCDDDVRAMVMAAHLIVRKYVESSVIEIWSETHCVGRITNPRQATLQRPDRSRPRTAFRSR